MIKPFYVNEEIQRLEGYQKSQELLERFIDSRLNDNCFNINIAPLGLKCPIEVINEVLEKYRKEGWSVKCDFEFYSFVWQTVYTFLP